MSYYTAHLEPALHLVSYPKPLNAMKTKAQVPQCWASVLRATVGRSVLTSEGPTVSSFLASKWSFSLSHENI